MEVNWAKEVAGRVRKGDSNGPSNELQRIRDMSGREELDVAIINDAVNGACRKVIPLWPPAAAWMTHRFIGRMLQHELYIIDARGGRVDAIRAGSCEHSVHANEVPPRSSSASWKVRDEEEFVRAGSKG